MRRAEEARARGRQLMEDILADDRRVAARYAETLARVAAATGWRRDTWSSGAPCLRKACGRIASDREIAAVIRTLDAAERGS